jgi:hypothetical protein
MYPLLIEGGRLLAPAIVAAAKSIPTAQLARFGLLRGPLVGLGPTVGAFLGGAAVMALLVPGSRAWLGGQATRALHLAREWSARDGESGASALQPESQVATATSHAARGA